MNRNRDRRMIVCVVLTIAASAASGGCPATSKPTAPPPPATVAKPVKEDQLNTIKTDVQKEILRQYGSDFKFASILSNRLFQDRLLEKAGFPSLESWIKENTDIQSS